MGFSKPFDILLIFKKSQNENCGGKKSLAGQIADKIR